jgi:hypothetical protein
LCSKLLAPTQQLSTAEYIGWKKVMVAISVQKEMKGICEHGKLKVTTKVGHACLGGNGHQSSNIRRKQTALTSLAERYMESMSKSKMLPNLPAQKELLIPQYSVVLQVSCVIFLVISLTKL